MTSQKLVKRVAKLQSLATSTNPNEAEQAAKQALRLMREHCISQADVDAIKDEKPDPLICRELYIDGLRLVDLKDVLRRVYRVAGWKRALFFAVGEYMGLRGAYYPGKAFVDYMGFASDVQAAVNLFEVCAKQIHRQGEAHLAKIRATPNNDQRWWTPADYRTEGFSFKESAVEGLQSKFADLMKESEIEDSTGHGLVLNRKAQVSDWVDANYSFKEGKGEGLGGEVGYSQAGYQAGRELSLIGDAELSGSAARKALG